MSRVLNLQATDEELAALCVKMGIGVSVIEPLLSGGTRIVLDNVEGTESLRRLMAKKLVEGPIKRSPLHIARTQITYL